MSEPFVSRWLSTWREFAGRVIAQQDRWMGMAIQDNPFAWEPPRMAHVLTPTRIEEWLNNTFRTAAMVHGLDLVFPVEDYRIEVDADIDARIFGIHVRCPDGIKTLPRILREAEDAEKAFCEANPHTPFDLSARP